MTDNIENCPTIAEFTHINQWLSLRRSKIDNVLVTNSYCYQEWEK